MSLPTELILLALFAAAAFLLRLAWSGFEAADTRGVWWRLPRQRRSRWLDYRVVDNIVPAAHGYPVLFHWLLARLPERFWISGGFLVNAALDLVVAGGVWALLRFASRPPPALVGDGREALVADAAAILVLFAPCLFPPTARLMAFNGRAFGLLLHFGLTVALGAHVLAGSWPALIVAGLLLVGIVLSSQFAFQASVVTMVALAVVFRSWAVIVVPAAVVAAGCAARPVGLREPLRYFLGLYGGQYRNRRHNTMPTARARWLANTWREIVVRRRLANVWRYVLLNSPQVLTVLYGPAFLGVAWFAVFRPEAFAATVADPPLRFALVAAAAMVAAAVLTSFPPLSIFGQAERYLEYGTPFAAALVAVLLFHGERALDAAVAGLLILLGASAAVIMVNLLVTAALRGQLMGGVNRNLRREKPSFVDWLPRDREIRVATVPMSQCKALATAAGGEDDLRVRTVYDWLSPDGERPLAYMDRYLHGLTFTPEGLRRLVDDHRFDGVLLFKKGATVWHESRRASDPETIFSAFEVRPALVGEDEDYALYMSVDDGEAHGP